MVVQSVARAETAVASESGSAADIDWHSDVAVRAVRANWQAMSIVHFVLLFRELLGMRPFHALQCIPERAVAFRLRSFDDEGELRVGHPRISAGPETSTAVAAPSSSTASPLSSSIRESSDDELVLSGDEDPECVFAGDRRFPRPTAASTINPGDKDERQVEQVFDCLVMFLASEVRDKRAADRLRRKLLAHVSLVERVDRLKHLCDEAAERSCIRDVVGGTAKTPILSAVRLVSGSKDAAGMRYVWIRGFEGCPSGRIEITASAIDRDHAGQVIEGSAVEKMAVALETGPGARADRFSCAWLREKIRRSDTRTAKIEKEALAERNIIRISGEVVDVEACGRGKRVRKDVLYAEFEHSSDIVEALASSSEEEEEEDDVTDSHDDDYEAEPKRRRLGAKEDVAFAISDQDSESSDSDMVVEDGDVLYDDSTSPARNSSQDSAALLDSRFRPRKIGLRRARAPASIAEYPAIPRIRNRVSHLESSRPAYHMKTPEPGGEVESSRFSKRTTRAANEQKSRQRCLSYGSDSDFLVE
jgi:hypothetical protein